MVSIPIWGKHSDLAIVVLILPYSSFMSRTMKILTRLFLFLFVFCVLGGGAYYWWWHRLAAGVNQTIASLIEDQRQWGRTIAFGSVTVTGFPGPLQITLTTPVIVAARGGPAPLTYWRWDGPTLRGHLNVLSPTQVTIDASGSHRIDSVVGREPYNLRLVISDLSFVLNMEIGGLLKTLDVRAADVNGTAIETGTDFILKAFSSRIANEQPVLFSGSAHDLMTAAESTTGFGGKLDSATWTAKIFGDLPMVGGTTAVEQWRQAGGRIEIDHLRAQAADLEVSLQGPITLDENLQFNAQFTGWIRGWNILLQNLVATGAMSPSGSALANLGLRALARPPDEGGAPAVHAPLSLTNRRIFLGPVNLGTVPLARWE